MPVLVGFGLSAALFFGLMPALVAAIPSGSTQAPPTITPLLALFIANMKVASYLAIAAVGVLFTVMLYPVLKPYILWSRKRAAERAEREAEAARKLSGPGHFHPENVTGPTGAYLRFLAPLVSHPIGNIAVLVAVGAICWMVLNAFQDHNNGVEFFVDEEPEIAVILVAGPRQPFGRRGERPRRAPSKTRSWKSTASRAW